MFRKENVRALIDPLSILVFAVEQPDRAMVRATAARRDWKQEVGFI